MKTRTEVYQEFKQRIEEQGFREHEYVQYIDGKDCYCAVGHVMAICGVDIDTITDDGADNTMAIGTFPAEDLMPLLEYGLTVDELSALQAINDNTDVPYETRKKRLLLFADVMIDAGDLPPPTALERARKAVYEDGF